MKKLTFNKKSAALVLAGVMLAGGVAGGTLAWLTDETKDVTNTFTESDIHITLEETKDEFKMIPGWTIDKDPILTVKGGSEDCWLFLEVEETCDVFLRDGEYPMPARCEFDDFIAYQIDTNNWTPLAGHEGVYYCYANDIIANRDIKILMEGTYEAEDGSEYKWGYNQVLTKPEVTKQMMEAVSESNRPTLSFTGYAVQYWKNNTEAFTVEEAWAKVKPQESSENTGTPVN